MTPLPAGVSLRPATAEDAPATAAIYAHHVRNGTATFEIEPPDAAEMERRRSETAQRGLPYLVGLSDGEVIAYAYAAPYRPRPAYRFTVEDSNTWERPWSGEYTWRATKETIYEYACHEGNHALSNVLSGARYTEREGAVPKGDR